MINQQNKVAAHASAILGLGFVIICSVVLDAIYKPQKPVMQYLMTVSEWEFTESFAQVHLAGYKIRDCKIVDKSWKGKAIISGELVEEGIGFEWFEAKDDDDSFPTGYIYPRPARWTLPNIDRVNKLGLELTHDCNGRRLVSYYWYDVPERDDRARYVPTFYDKD